MTTLKSLVEQHNACSVPWVHVELSLQNESFRPCCKYSIDLGNIKDLKEIWVGEKYQQLRNDIKSNTKHLHCAACNVPENVFSYRNFKNKDYQRRNGFEGIDVDNPALPRFINLSLKNTCNLHCRMCSPYASSGFYKLFNRSEFLNSFYNFKRVNNRFDISQLKGYFINAQHLTITGGEPFMDDDCFRLIQMVQQESANLKSLTFSTNMTYMNAKLFKLFDSLHIPNRNIKINVSIDGPKHIHEYIRGCSWSTIINNLKLISSQYNFQFGINSTISILNIGYITDLINSVLQITQNTDIKFTHIMSTPVLQSYLHPGITAKLNSSIIDLYKQKLDCYSEIGDQLPGADELVRTARNFLETPTGDLDLFLKFIKEFDRVTGTDIHSVYPEFEKYR